MRVSAPIYLPPHAATAGDDLLGLTAGEFVARCAERDIGPGRAMTAYRCLFREGSLDQPIAPARTAPIVR
ncbi:MAG: hypothetical protein AAGK04_05770, partial [Planctomycetota bacterium]